jgi:phosphatidylinositol alpha-1,6-mannosyltransferase
LTQVADEKTVDPVASGAPGAKGQRLFVPGLESAAGPRTLFIAGDLPARSGTGQSYYWSLAQTLDPSLVTILAPTHPDAAAFDATHPFRMIRAHVPSLWPTQALLEQAVALARGIDAELVQIGHSFPASLLGPQLKERCGLPYVVFLNGAESLPAAVPGLKHLLRRVVEQAALVFAPDEHRCATVLRQGRGKVRAEVLRPPVDVEEYTPVTRGEAASLRRKLGIDGELVVCPGRLLPGRRQDRIIDAVALLQREYPCLHLALLGEGWMATRLYDRAHRRGLGRKVHITGALVDAAVNQWLQAADVVVSPGRGRWEGLQGDGCELMLAKASLIGAPLVVPAGNGSAEYVADGLTGVAVEAGSAVHLAAGLRTLLRLPAEQRREFGLRGRDLALSRHAPSAVTARYQELLCRAAWARENVTP